MGRLLLRADCQWSCTDARPRAKEVPAHAEAMRGPLAQVRAYIGVPLLHDGDRCTARCAPSPGPRSPDSLIDALRLFSCSAGCSARSCPANCRTATTHSLSVRHPAAECRQARRNVAGGELPGSGVRLRLGSIRDARRGRSRARVAYARSSCGWRAGERWACVMHSGSVAG
jgi:hypothetical protein